MKRADVVLADEDLDLLAAVLDIAPDDLRDDIEQHPRHLDELLASPAVVAAVIDGEQSSSSPMPAPSTIVSPRLLFAVFVQRSADDLAGRDWIEDWIGPGTRLPVFDVDPLVEFADAPARLHFLARLLVAFTVPSIGPFCDGPMDLDELVDWLDAVDAESHTALLRQLGDLALFQAGVFPDRSGATPMSAGRAEHLGRSVDMSDDELTRLVDPTSPTAGLDALEMLSASWYQAAAEASPTTPVLVRDVAHRIRAARRFLNYVADHYLLPRPDGGALGSLA